MTYLTTTSTLLVAAITLLTTAPFLSVAAEQGFGAAGTLNLDMELTGNNGKWNSYCTVPLCSDVSFSRALTDKKSSELTQTKQNQNQNIT